MVDLTRRKTVIGLGLLATGSGATFTSAAFNNSVNPSSDMRVVVDEKLKIEPGTLFRDGTDVDSTFDPSTANSSRGEFIFDNSSTSLFGGNGNPGLEDINPDELPAASITDETNQAIDLEVAIPIDDNGTIGDSSNGVFQVINDTSDTQDIAIRFNTLGTDAGGTVTNQDVVDIFKFKDSGDKHISTEDYSAGTVDAVAEVDPGKNEQIYIDYDTASSPQKGNLESATGTSNPFSGTLGETVDLVDKLGIGIEDGTDIQ